MKDMKLMKGKERGFFLFFMIFMVSFPKTEAPPFLWLTALRFQN